MKNYQLMLEEIIKENQDQGKKPTLLLHACCAPCSSYPIEYLSQYFDITLYFYNPNISSIREYNKRRAELKRFVEEFPAAKGIEIIDAVYTPQDFFIIAMGLENEPERGARCYECYRLRLEQTAKYASICEGKYDYFGTTLSISPHKNADWLNEIGEEMAKEYNVPYLFADFKKKNGYIRSIELSNEYNLYRQDFCGCMHSQKDKIDNTGKEWG